MNYKNFKKQSGFTLIELVIVVVVLGLLAIVGARAFSNTNISEGSKAQAMFEGCSKLSTSAILVANEAGVSSAVTGSALPAGTAGATTLLDVLAGGFDNMATAYQPAWTRAGVSPLSDVIKGSAGVYTLAGYALTFGGGGTTAHTCVVSVPDGVASALVVRYGAGTAPALAADTDTSNATIRYTALASGNRTVTIRRPL